MQGLPVLDDADVIRCGYQIAKREAQHLDNATERDDFVQEVMALAWSSVYRHWPRLTNPAGYFITSIRFAVRSARQCRAAAGMHARSVDSFPRTKHNHWQRDAMPDDLPSRECDPVVLVEECLTINLATELFTRE